MESKAGSAKQQSGWLEELGPLYQERNAALYGIRHPRPEFVEQMVDDDDIKRFRSLWQRILLEIHHVLRHGDIILRKEPIGDFHRLLACIHQEDLFLSPGRRSQNALEAAPGPHPRSNTRTALPSPSLERRSLREERASETWRYETGQ